MALSTTEIEKRISYLSRGTEKIIERDELAWKIERVERENRPLIVKLGVDPTAPDLHLGHTVPLMKLRHFQDLGYEINFLIGDFTARIGDPSGRSAARKPMTSEEVLANAEQYKKQIFKILIPKLTKIVYNSDWLSPIKLEDFIKIIGKGTVNDMIKRRGVANRLDDGNPVSVAEFVYPFLQAYDSVAMRADIEVGGEDQYFNFVFTRELQRAYGQEPQVVMTLPLLLGTDGKEKMSKTYNNHIALRDSPIEMFGKVMSINDELIIPYFDLLTHVPTLEINELTQRLLQHSINPREAKVRLGKEIVGMYHNEEEAFKAESEFDRVHKYHQAPEEINTIILSGKQQWDLAKLLVEVGLAKSNSNAKRLITHGGVRINEEAILNPHYDFIPEENTIINVGKREFRRIKYEQ